VNCPYAPTTPTVHSTTISRFLRTFFTEWPLILVVITIHQLIWPSPGTLITFWKNSHSHKPVKLLVEYIQSMFWRGISNSAAKNQGDFEKKPLHWGLVVFLRWGWVFLERAQILSGIQFTTHFIENFVVQTKPFVGRFVNVILTRQTCVHCSSRAAESKRRALGNYFFE